MAEVAAKGRRVAKKEVRAGGKADGKRGAVAKKEAGKPRAVAKKAVAKKKGAKKR
jgi:hypothetical protein